MGIENTNVTGTFLQRGQLKALQPRVSLVVRRDVHNHKNGLLSKEAKRSSSFGTYYRR